MSGKRIDRDDSDIFDGGDDTAAVATALRPHGLADKAKGDDEKMHVFWRVFGGTLVSVVALVGITLYNNLSSSISELRAELHKLTDAKGELVKKDEFNSRLSNNYERLRDLQTQNNTQNATLTSLKTEIDGFKERAARHGADVDALKKDAAALDALKEKLTAVAGDLRAIRDDSQKLRQDVDRNQAADAERKARRDEQHKDFDKAVKELQAAVQACEVKLARLEGSQGKPAAKTTPARAVAPKENESAPKPKAGDGEE